MKGRSLLLALLWPGVMFWIFFSLTLIYMGDLQELKKARKGG